MWIEESMSVAEQIVYWVHWKYVDLHVCPRMIAEDREERLLESEEQSVCCKIVSPRRAATLIKSYQHLYLNVAWTTTTTKNCNKHVKVHGRRIMSLKPKKEQARKLIFNAFTNFHRWFKDLLVAWQGVNATLLHVSIIVLFVWLKVSKGPICQGLYLANRRGEE